MLVSVDGGAVVVGVPVSVDGAVVTGVPVSVAAGGGASVAGAGVSVAGAGASSVTVVTPPPPPCSRCVGDGLALLGVALAGVVDVVVATGVGVEFDVSFSPAKIVAATTIAASTPPPNRAGGRRYHGLGSGGGGCGAGGGVPYGSRYPAAD